MDLEDLRNELAGLFDQDPGKDGGPSTGDISHPRLEAVHGLDLSCLDTFGLNWEGSTMHPRTRSYPPDEHQILPLIRNLDVPHRLFDAGLRLFGDSILAYHGKTKRVGVLHYYPPVILTFWSGFETFVRHTSELLLFTVQKVPPTVASFLRDEEEFVSPKGDISKKKRYRSVLARYRVLLRYGYGYHLNCSSKHWQGLERAKTLRDYYTHLDVNDPRSLSSEEVSRFRGSSASRSHLAFF